jgi:hypothetical protein
MVCILRKYLRGGTRFAGGALEVQQNTRVKQVIIYENNRFYLFKPKTKDFAKDISMTIL